MLFNLIPSSALAVEDVVKIRIDKENSAKLLGDIKYYKDTITKMQEMVTVRDNTITVSDKEIALLKQKTDLQKTDIDLLIKAKDDYKDLYTKENIARLKAEEEKPSRTLWFTGGVLTAVVIGVLGILVTK
jgi:uncharacterized protein (UPF0305 family)